MDNVTAGIIAQYDIMNEDKRLEGGFGSLEKERTKELISRYLSPEPLSILDIGGGTGIYSLWLAGLGHHVRLIDIVPKHVELALEKAKKLPNTGLFNAEVGDARQLEVEDCSIDLVILAGPLYHLVQRDDRAQTLNEAHRVLEPGGTLLAFTITRYAGINYAIPNGLVFDDLYYAVMREEVATGVCNNDPPKIKTFTNAYFHSPDEVAAEITAAGLLIEKTLGVLGTSWLVPELNTSWKDPVKRKRIMEIARLLEDEPVLGPRMMTVGRKG